MARIGRSHATAMVMAMAGLAACDSITVLDPGRGNEPRDLEGEYSWIFEGWTQGAAVGYPSIELVWGLPSQHRDEVFRVYARRASSGSYALIATVTSCSAGLCRYIDANISNGSSYDYYVATFDERTGSEIATTGAIRVTAPQRGSLSTPTAPVAVSLDRAVYLRWTPDAAADRYFIVVQLDDGSTYRIGETDGGSFFDNRAENGTRYRYYIAAVDEHGHVSSLSQSAVAFPRPDYHADVVYAFADRPNESGFRFVANETDNPIVPGTANNAHWRLERSGETLRIQPLGNTAITAGVFTTALSCGPGSDDDCEDVRTAPAANQFGTGAVTVQTGHTYVLRVTGSDNQTHYAKLRVQGPSVDENGARLIVFDWAYQVRANEPSLGRVRS